jgi:endo-1,4-beta-mannosidase
VRSVYDDPWLLRTMVFNIRQVVGRFRSHPAVFGWDTGNEPDVFQRPLSRESQWLWNSLLVGEIKRLDPVHPVVCGVHIWSLDADPAPSVPIRIDDQAEINDLAIMHAYSIYCDAAKGPMDTDVVPFCCALTSHLARKPVLFQEFGLCTAPPGAGSEAVTVRLPHRIWSQYVASEEEAALYVGEVLEKLWRVGAVGAWIWCFADYAPELWDRPPCDLLFHERTFGLFRSDGSPKPHADVIRRFASLRRPVCAEPVHFDFGGISPDEYYSDPRAHFRRLFAGFVWPLAGLPPQTGGRSCSPGNYG